MRIKYFGENKERGLGRVAVIRFTDNEFDLYEYIAKYENTYGDSDREFFNGHIIGIERDENGVWINEAWINVDDFTDFNDLKANYKEAKKEFKSLKKQATETKPETATDPETTEAEETTDPEVGKFVYDVRIHNAYGWDTYTVAGDDVESAEYKALKRVEYECGKEERSSIDVIRIYKEGTNDLLKEIITKEIEEPETADQGETAESDTKQYECENVVQVAHKVADLTKTRLDRQVWKEYCDDVKKDGSSWFDYTAFDPGGNEFDVSIFLGYDQQSRHYFVSVDYEKCPVPDMSGGA